ncbi:MAG: helix-turn-helix transcriptional regulator [candidate division WOR-3 bacterium]
MNFKNNLNALEILREFAIKVVPLEIYQKNLILERIETPNKRLWTLREFLKLDEKTFARKMEVDYNQYYQYEKMGNPVPFKLLKKVSKTFNVSIDWLTCRKPLYPIDIITEK